MLSSKSKLDQLIDDEDIFDSKLWLLVYLRWIILALEPKTSLFIS